MKRVLLISQVITQDYINIIEDALGKETVIDVISGSDISGKNIRQIKSPMHDPRSFRSRLICWRKHWSFVKAWVKKHKNEQYDLIYMTSNPPINSYIGLKLKKVYNAPFVYMNWDLYPQIIETTIQSLLVKIICKIWHHWNFKNYPKINRILTIGPRMAESVKNHTKSIIDISVIPLGIDTSRFLPVEKKKNAFLLNNHLENQFIVLFSGKMGVGHNIELILNAANLLKEKEDIAFVFIGSGPKYCVIENYLKNYSGKNIHLFPWQEADMYPYSISCGDVAIITEEKAAEGLMLPSRVFCMMSCGEAIIGICGENDDLYSLVTRNKIGVCVTTDSVQELADSIIAMYEDNQELKRMKARARKLAERDYSDSIVKAMYRTLFSEIIV